MRYRQFAAHGGYHVLPPHTFSSECTKCAVLKKSDQVVRLVRERCRTADTKAFVEELGQVRPQVPKLLVGDNAPPIIPRWYARRQRMATSRLPFCPFGRLNSCPVRTCGGSTRRWWPGWTQFPRWIACAERASRLPSSSGYRLRVDEISTVGPNKRCPGASKGQFGPIRGKNYTWAKFTCQYDHQLEEVYGDGRRMPSLSLGLDLMRDRLGIQLAQVDAIDSKAGVLFASSSFVTGVLVAWHKLPSRPPAIVQWLPFAAIVLYAVVVLLSAIAFFTRTYTVSPKPLVMRDKLVFLESGNSEDEIFHGLVVSALRNNQTIGAKLHWLYVAFIAFSFQVAVVVVIVWVEIATINTSS